MPCRREGEGPHLPPLPEALNRCAPDALAISVTRSVMNYAVRPDKVMWQEGTDYSPLLRRSNRLPLHRPRRQPVDQMALQKAEQHRHRDRAQDDAGR